ncbi:MAG: CHASE3 domain-containing protein [Planctomycetaceae bacterium]|nr:CHASE3 domain-containing protein [Planctomycetaceae bacterium]
MTSRAHFGFAGLVALLLLFAYLSYRNTQVIVRSQKWVEHTYQVTARLEHVSSLLRDSEAGIRGFVVTDDQTFLASHTAAVAQLDQALEGARELVHDNEGQGERFANLERMVRHVVAGHARVVGLRRSEGFEAARAQIKKGEINAEAEAAREQIAEMRRIEADLLATRRAQVRAAEQFATATNLLTTLAAILTIVLVYALNASYIRGRDRAAGLIQAERERLRVTLASIGDGVISTDVMGHVTFLNPVAERLTGWTNEDAIGVPIQRVFQIVNEETRETVQNPVEKVLERGAIIGLANHTILLSKSGEEWPIDDSAAPIRDPEGQLQGVVLIFREISERRQAERELQETRKAAETANRAKSEFLANMSHEIRTPMAAILGYSELMVPHLQDDHCRNCVAIIKRNGQFLLDIINDILDLSRIEAGRLEIERTRFDLAEAVNDVLSMMSVRAQEKNIELKAEYVGRLPATIESDAVRLRQILVNLIGNAIKFTEQGRVNVAVERLASAEPPKLRFTVSDTGIGISPELQSQLFQPFSQGDGSIRRRFGGTGLGLTISKRLAVMLGGDISVKSQVGRGSSFSVTIAIAPLDSNELLIPDRTAGRPAGAVEPALPQIAGRILIVDDRRDVRFLAQEIVTKAGGQVETADDGREAIRLIREREATNQPYDLVVMDMQMPVLDGYETVRILREGGYRKPIIALTAGAMAGDRERCLESGCNSYVSKPIDRKELLRVISSELAGAGQGAPGA